MPLTLTLLRCPDNVAPETRSVGGGELSIGRGAENDWVLPDPERHLSKRHCVVAFRGGEWHVNDLSTNGTYLNADKEPIGAGHAPVLRDGDRLRLGAYEIEARLTEERFGGSAMWPGIGRDAGPAAASRPFSGDLFSGAPNPFEEERPPGSISLPADYDPLAPEPADPPHSGPTQPDHSPPIEDAFRPPRPAASLLPDDWDLDLSRGSATPPSRPELISPEPERPGLPEPREGDLMAAFLEGAGMAGARPGDDLATMRMLGRAFRAIVAGLRQLMIARAGIKSEFRIEQTMIRASGNNPLKFSADDDDALAALLDTGRHAGMAPDAAVADALQDMRAHELATVAAMQEAMRAVLARIDPARIRDSAGGALVPAQRKARAWDAYEKLHATTVKALSDDFESLFGQAFARAYEKAIRQIAERSS